MTTKNCHFWLTFLLCVALSMTLVQSACAARPTPDAYHSITATKLTDTVPFHYPICLDATTDTLFGWDRVNNQLDVYDGSAWQTALDLSAHPDAGANMRRIFIDSNENIFFSFLLSGKLYKVTQRPMALADSFAFVNSDADFMYMGEEATDGDLYVGEYTPLADTSAHIWRSADSGANWSHVYHDASGDHVHFTIPDPYRAETVYAAIGDGLGNSSLVKTVNDGTDWTAILDTDVRSQATDVLFLYDRRMFGMDCRVSERDSTGVFETTDDSAFTDVMDLVSPYDSQIFAMSMNADSVAFAATFGRGNDESDNIAIYRRAISGTWSRVSLLGTSADNGVWDMTEFDSNGYAYYSDRLNGGVYKFIDDPSWTIGTGGDFADIATALADWRVGPNATLWLLAAPATHDLEDANLYDGMTIRGYSGDYNDVTVMATGATHDGFVVDSTAVFRDFTLRNTTAFDNTHFGMDFDFATTDVTCDNVRFAGMSGGIGLAGFSNSNNPDAVRYRNCVFDSCSQTQDGYGLVQVTDPAIFVARDCVFSNNVTKRSVLTINQTADGDGGAADTLLVTGCLFVDNRARQSYGGALRLTIGADCEESIIEYCTFVNNESVNTPADGQVYVASGGLLCEMYHCIITGADSTNAIRDANNEFKVIEHCNAWGNLDNWFSKGLDGTATDTLHIDPLYNDECAASPCYTAKAKDCRDSADGSYMGWLHYLPDSGAAGGHRRTVRRRR